MQEKQITEMIGDKVKEVRQRLGLSQNEAGEQVGGISFQQWQKYEQGKNRISAAKLFMFAETNGIPVSSLFPIQESQDGDARSVVNNDSYVAAFTNMLGVRIQEANAAKGFWDAPDEIVALMSAFHGAELTEEQQKALYGVEAKFENRNVGELLALIHSEVSEGLEGHRKNLDDDHLPHRKSLEVELADAMIRILDMAAGLKLDLGGAMVDKLAYNAKRPKKHGKKY